MEWASLKKGFPLLSSMIYSFDPQSDSFDLNNRDFFFFCYIKNFEVHLSESKNIASKFEKKNTVKG